MIVFHCRTNARTSNYAGLVALTNMCVVATCDGTSQL